MPVTRMRIGPPFPTDEPGKPPRLRSRHPADRDVFDSFTGICGLPAKRMAFAGFDVARPCRARLAPRCRLARNESRGSGERGNAKRKGSQGELRELLLRQ